MFSITTVPGKPDHAQPVSHQDLDREVFRECRNVPGKYLGEFLTGISPNTLRENASRRETVAPFHLNARVEMRRYYN